LVHRERGHQKKGTKKASNAPAEFSPATKPSWLNDGYNQSWFSWDNGPSARLENAILCGLSPQMLFPCSLPLQLIGYHF